MNKPLPPERSGNLPEEHNYWFFYPFRDKYPNYPSAVILLEEDKKPFYQIKEYKSSQDIKENFSQIKSKNSEKYKPDGKPNQ